jgi:hypothetical protein
MNNFSAIAWGGQVIFDAMMMKSQFMFFYSFSGGSRAGTVYPSGAPECYVYAL